MIMFRPSLLLAALGLMLFLVARPVAAESFTYSNLAGFGTSAEFTIDPGSETLPGLFTPTADGLRVTNSIGFGGSVGGFWSTPKDWSNLRLDSQLGLLMSVSGTNKETAFSIQFFSLVHDEIVLLDTFQGASTSAGSTTTFLPLTLPPALDEWGKPNPLRGTGDFSSVYGFQFTWDDAWDNANLTIHGLGILQSDAPQEQTITFDALAPKVFGAQPFNLSAATTSRLPLSYSSDTPSVATVSSNGVVTIFGAGTTTITVSQEGNSEFKAADPVSQVLTVEKAPQTITSTPLPTGRKIGDVFPVTATSPTPLTLSFISSNPEVATVSLTGSITVKGYGTTTITVSQGGNANYLPATSIELPLTVTDPHRVAKHLGQGIYATESSRLYLDPPTAANPLEPGQSLASTARLLAKARGGPLPAAGLVTSYDRLSTLLDPQVASLGWREIPAAGRNPRRWEVGVPNFTLVEGQAPRFASLTLHTFNANNGRLIRSATLARTNAAQFVSVLGRERLFNLDLTGDGMVGDRVTRSLGQGLYVTVSGRVWFDPDHTSVPLLPGSALGFRARVLANTKGAALSRTSFESGYNNLQTLLGAGNASLGARAVSASVWEVVVPLFQAGTTPPRFASLAVHTFNASNGRLIRTTTFADTKATQRASIYEREMVYNLDFRGDQLIGFPRLYVREPNENETAEGRDGASWDTAFFQLQDAIDAAEPGQEIWVAEGTYLPTKKDSTYKFVDPLDPRSATFVLRAGIHIFGGFQSGDTNRARRTGGETILSGDLADNDRESGFWENTDVSDYSALLDNAYHVVLADKLTVSTRLDGLTITGGFAVPDPSTLEQVKYSIDGDPDNYGGGIVSLASNLVIHNCRIERNIAAAGGGGIFAFSAPLAFQTLVGDSVTTDILISARVNRQLRVTDTTFAKNLVPDFEYSQTRDLSGGAVAIGDNYTANFRNVRFDRNSAPNGGAISVQAAEGLRPLITEADRPTVRFYACEFLGNEAICSPALEEEPDYLTDGIGGAIYAGYRARVDVGGSLFSANKAGNPAEYVGSGGHGAAIAADARSRVRVATSVFAGNESSWAGGAINAADWLGEGRGTDLQVFFSTFYNNRAFWGAGINNFRAAVSGRANIFHQNISPANSELNKAEFFSDIANTINAQQKVTSRSTVSHSVFTQVAVNVGAVNANSGPGNTLFSGDVSALFRNTEDAHGRDGRFGTADDGFMLNSPVPIAKTAMKRPIDFADANGNGKFTELLPFDARRKALGAGPYDRGAYQR